MSLRANTRSQRRSDAPKVSEHPQEKPLPPDLRAVRKHCGLTLGRVEKETGLRRGRISELERGERSPKTSELDALARCYGVQGWRVISLVVLDEDGTP